VKLGFAVVSTLLLVALVALILGIEIPVLRWWHQYKTPALYEEVTWTTGLAFRDGGMVPYVVWLPNEDPLAVRYRKAKGPSYKDDEPESASVPSVEKPS
jgi:hypothetical protein